MSILAWTVCIATFLAGLAIQGETALPLAETLATGLYAVSLLACPTLWKLPPLDDLLDAQQRVLACVALVLALPLLLVPAG